MKDRDRYLKIVEWSEEDKCYVGRCPGLMMGGVHGIDEQKVFRELCTVIDEWIETIKKDGKPLPKATANKEYSGRFLLRVGNDLHRALAVRALKADQSLNSYAMQILKDGIMPGGSRRNTTEGANTLKKPGSPPSASQVSLLHCRTELSTQWKQADSTARMSNMPRLTARVPVWKFTLGPYRHAPKFSWPLACPM